MFLKTCLANIQIIRRPTVLEKLQYVQVLTSEVFQCRQFDCCVAVCNWNSGALQLSLVVFLQWWGVIGRDAVNNTRRFLNRDSFITSEVKKAVVVCYDAKGPVFRFCLKVSHYRNSMVYITDSQSVLQGSQGFRGQFPGIRGYISVMAALKFTLFFKSKE